MSAMETGEHQPEGDVDANHWLPYADEAYANAAGFLPTLLAGIREGAEKKDWNRSANPSLVPSAVRVIERRPCFQHFPQVLFDFPIWEMTAVALYQCANDEKGDVPPEMLQKWACRGGRPVTGPLCRLLRKSVHGLQRYLDLKHRLPRAQRAEVVKILYHVITSERELDQSLQQIFANQVYFHSYVQSLLHVCICAFVRAIGIVAYAHASSSASACHVLQRFWGGTDLPHIDQYITMLPFRSAGS
jgi:hypothetical protein